MKVIDEDGKIINEVDSVAQALAEESGTWGEDRYIYIINKRGFKVKAVIPDPALCEDRQVFDDLVWGPDGDIASRTPGTTSPVYLKEFTAA